MKLYVMRHGPAEDRSESGIDGDRALTVGGRGRVRAVAEALIEHGEEPSSIVTSPLMRAVQTAEIVAVVARLHARKGGVSARRAMAPGGAALELTRELAAGGTRRVMLVGHEPDLSGLVTGLLGAPFGATFEKAMVVGLHLTSGADIRLRFVLYPRTLRFEPAPAP